MSIDRLFNWSSAALLLLSVVGIGVALDAPWVLLGSGVLVVVARAVTDGPRGRVMGRRLSLLITLIAAVVAVYLIWQDPMHPLPAIAGFALTLAVVKCFEHRTMENEAERIVLSYLLIALAAMISVEALFGLVFLLWAPLMCVVLLLFQVQYGRRRFGGSPGDEEATPPPAGPRARRHLVSALGLNVVLIAAGAVVLFLLFPRGVTGELALAGASPIARTAAGADQHLELVSGARVLSSAAEVARVTQLAGEPPAGGVLRLRTGTMSEYTGAGKWHPTRLAYAADVPVRPGWTTVDADPAPALVEYRIELVEPMAYLPVPAGLREIKGDRSTRVAWDAVRGVLSAAPNGMLLRYDVRADPSNVQASPLIDPYWAWSDPDVRRLAQAILERADLDPFSPVGDASRATWIDDAAHAFVRHLRSGTYHYTLDLTRVGQDESMGFSRDPVTRFLLEEPVGHCEYFAAGFTALSHAVGIPARIVTGFVAMDRDEVGRWIVRDRDAHAWSEVLVTPDRWQPFDATPAAGPLFGGLDSDGSLMARWTRLRSTLEVWWYGSLLGYDASAQRMLGNSIMPDWQERLAALRRNTGHLRNRLDLFFGAGPVGTVWFLVVVLLCVGAGVLLVRRRRRRRLLARALQLEGPRDERLEGMLFYGELLRLLHRGGFDKPRHCSPLAFADAVAQRRPDVARAMHRLVAVLYRRRFGPGDTTPAAVIESDLNDIAGGLGLRRGRGT